MSAFHDTAALIAELQATHIVKLQTAARTAGLKFKNGAPGFDKQGIIDRLSLYPAMLAATAATIRRMGGESVPSLPSSGLLDDIADEAREKPASGAPAPSADISRLEYRVKSLEDTRATRAQIPGMLADATAPLRTRLEAAEKRIAELESRKPVIMQFPDRKPITVESGAHRSYPKLLQYLQINRRVILTGSAGTGKSMAVKNAAEHFGVPFYLQTPVSMAHEYLGHKDAHGVFHETPTFQAYVNGGLLLWDEADAGLPDAMLAANPIFDGNGFAMFGDGKMYKQHPDFMAVFNMNTDGNGSTMQYAGRNRLDGATLARFGVRIHWEIDADIESAMAGKHDAWLAAVRAVRGFMESRGIVDVNATPRHTKTGAMLLEAGQIPRRELLSDVLKSGALAEVWRDVESLPAVQTFLRG